MRKPVSAGRSDSADDCTPADACGTPTRPDVWDNLAQGRLPAGVKNRFVLLARFEKSLPAKENPDETDPWNIRPNDIWKEREFFESEAEMNAFLKAAGADMMRRSDKEETGH